MNKLRFSALALALAAGSPAAALAGEDQGSLEGLDVTMIVLDSSLDLESSVKQLDDPGDVNNVDGRSDENESVWHYEEDSEGEFQKRFKGDDFIKNEDEMSKQGDLDDRDDIDVDELRVDDETSID